jgi:alkanesulfonate monooxygenase SsuD/methylene tetrahydromethanopterin reductase-like flavin-dependent oxidoreductase (luciferase family)
MTLGIGLYLPTWHRVDGSIPRWTDMRTLALDAESLGVSTLWVSDEPGFWECWTILTALAEATDRIEIGPLVVCTRYRSPALFATMVGALDEVSDGRLVLGLGSGVPADPRWPAFGWDARAPIARFEEAVEIITRLLRTGPMTFDGRFYQVAEPDIGFRGPRQGGPPIWIAGWRPRTMAVAARWGDSINSVEPLTSPDAVAAFRTGVVEACVAVDRDPSTLALTGFARVTPSADGRRDADRTDTIAGSPAQIADRLAEIQAAGISHLTCFIGDDDDERSYPLLTRAALDSFAPVLEWMSAR